ncbi:MAG TPA: hypothetical protein VFA70_09500, partial [Dehalococcoidia bacterium]|nr:hypothetical protein [Dehalococcoidia bacterium]
MISGSFRASALLALLLVALMALSSGLAGKGRLAPSRSAQANSCRMATADGTSVQHVIYLQFDNTHERRDVPDVPSDLEQMPHLRDFLTQNGTLFTNDHTILISHTTGGIVTALTGLYPDRNGQTVSTSYDYFTPSGAPRPASSFRYWTDTVSAADPLPNMVTDGQQTTPAPWVAFTRAGCDVGGVGIANMELEDAATAPAGDITTVFGANSPEWNEASDPAQRARAQADFVGIAVHCSLSPSSLCAGDANARPDLLPDEPGGYAGYQALFGARYVDPAITGGAPCVNDTAGQPITDPAGNCGFPGFDGMVAKNALGYVAQLQESGVPVTFAYLSDAHDVHTPDAASDSYRSRPQGPGEAGFAAQLKAYDDAFAAFFQSLAQHGIDKSNTLFVVTVDEGDHFLGGAGAPKPDGTLAYAHASCADLTACPSNQL